MQNLSPKELSPRPLKKRKPPILYRMSPKGQKPPILKLEQKQKRGVCVCVDQVGLVE
jgi:hypothetical protein